MSLWTAREKIDAMARLGDLAAVDCRLLLGLDALLDLLAEKGILSREEFVERCRRLDRAG